MSAIKICGATDPGLRCFSNQDCYLAGKMNDSTCWLILCDGMGGMAEGSVASRLAARAAAAHLDASLSGFVDEDRLGSLLLEAVDAANTAVFEANRDRDGDQMGTTIVAAAVKGNTAAVCHCGDSRAYVCGRRNIRQITKDHSVVQELVDAGQLTAEQARNHPNKNVITRALGVEETAEADLNEVRLQKGEMLLLCCDGLSNVVPDSEIWRTCSSADFYAVPGLLIRRALDAGGPDNITCLILSV